MQDQPLHSIILGAVSSLPQGPVAILFAEDPSEIAGTIAHHQKLGFDAILLIGDDLGVLPAFDAEVRHLPVLVRNRDHVVEMLNLLIPALAGRWIYWGFNAEYLFFPFCESRSIKDLTAFMEEERRSSVFTSAIDLYAGDLYRATNAVDPSDAYLDRSGYYSFQRYRDGQPLDRQFNIFGGLGWRFEEFVPWERRRIDRVSLFKARSDLTICTDLLLSDDEMNTVSSKWHHNITCAVMSFRVAKSLKRNPGSTFEIANFTWRQSERFSWTSTQLMELGFIEPGQWF
ncbi:hypothetical protein FHS89_003005 [Rubricella aquisinus]|uniref:Glycosyl transferase family 2 n=1 Tax=Rubricella aquisinus TaxID=2028108 RepID=A0A840WQH2_9RHOB|nr:hypothetical protein [Rubricella aquisinus]MBB5516961.1 hypothetical protein [Rubricella aquisinus]